jgi:hypothetical protein
MLAMTNEVPVKITDRFEPGCYLTIRELATVKHCGITTIYADIKAGVLKVEKHGRLTRISGPIAKGYVPGSRPEVA